MKPIWFYHSLLFIFALTLILFTAHPPAFTQPPSTPTTWQTFNDPCLGFQLDYPSDWVVRLVADNTDGLADHDEGVVWQSIGFFGSGSQMMFVDVWRNERGLSLDEWATQHPSFIEQGLGLTYHRSQTKLAGQRALHMVSRPEDNVSGPPWYYRTQLAYDELIIGLEYAALNPDLVVYQAMSNSFAPLSLKCDSPLTLSTDLPPVAFGVREATCCGIVDFEYNPFPCNEGGGGGCNAPPCGNCTWWARYRREGGNEANLTRCTGDAETWRSCAESYYPDLVSSEPAKAAVTVYIGQNHLSYIEWLNDKGSYQSSQMSWDASCPDTWVAENASNNRLYILHPDYTEPPPPPNLPPYQPSPQQPDKHAWLTSRTILFEWRDGGDPDQGPADTRFMLRVMDENSKWDMETKWLSKTEYELTLPLDSTYRWQVKAYDGEHETSWTVKRFFYVDTIAPAAPQINTTAGLNQWHQTDQRLTWTVSDNEGGSGIDYVKWGWNDDSPDHQVDAAEGQILLSTAGQGQHTLYVQAWDGVGHASGLVSLGWLGYDTIAPTVNLAPQNPAGRWYNIPTVIAVTAQDVPLGSGLNYVAWAWNDTPTIVDHDGQLEAALPLSRGSHTLFAQAQDYAQNTTEILNLGQFGFDYILPTPPVIQVNCAISNNQPQNICPNPTFSWAATDRGSQTSGVQDYAYAWGTETDLKNVVWSDWQMVTSFTPPPVSNPSRHFLHVAVRDRANNQASTATFGLWYDENFTPVAPPTVETFLVSLDDNALYTRYLTPTLRASGPNVVEAAFSDLYVPETLVWQPTPLTTTWTLPSYGSSITPHHVYAWFRDAQGIIYGPYHDNILLDPTPPRGHIRIVGADDAGLTLTVAAQDEDSGLTEMRLGQTVTETRQAAWQAYAPTAAWPHNVPILYVQFRDLAGNVSSVYGTDGRDSRLTERMYLPLVFRKSFK